MQDRGFYSMMAAFVLIGLVLVAITALNISRPSAVEPIPPEQGAVLQQTLTERVGTADTPYIGIGAYRYYNDGPASDWMMITGVWENGNAPDDFLIHNGAYVSGSFPTETSKRANTQTADTGWSSASSCRMAIR